MENIKLNYGNLNGKIGTIERTKKGDFKFWDFEEVETKKVSELITSKNLMTNYTFTEEQVIRAWKKGDIFYSRNGKTWTILKLRVAGYDFTLTVLYNRDENKIIRVGDVRITQKLKNYIINNEEINK